MNGSYSGGGNEYAKKKTKAKKKYSWIHGELRTLMMTHQTIQIDYTGIDCVVCVSKAMQNEFDTIAGGIVESRYIRNMYDFDKIRELCSEWRQSARIKKNKLSLITVSRLDSPAMRSDRINKIAKLLKDYGLDFEWNVIGGGRTLEEFREQSTQLCIDDTVHYLGEINEPYDLFKNADLFILTSDSEAYPTVLIESLILGVPVITTNFASAYEIVIDGENGFITEKNEVEIADKIIYVAKHPDILAAMGEKTNCIKADNRESIDSICAMISE